MDKPTPERQKELREVFKGIEMMRLAKALKTTPAYAYNIMYGYRSVGWKRAIEIEEITKKMGRKVPRAVLRPDIFGVCKSRA